MKRTLLGIGTLTVLGFAWTLHATTEKNLQSAIAEQRRVVASAAGNGVALNDLGNLLEEAGELAEAEMVYQEAIAASPTRMAPRYNLALLYAQQGKRNKAIDQLEGILEIEPRHARANFQLGRLYEEKGRRNKAIEHYATAFIEAPSLSFSRNNPQILDSKLAMEALIETGAQLEGERARARRQYGEGRRIASLLAGEELYPQADAGTKDVAKAETAETAEVEKGDGTPRVITNNDLTSTPRPAGAAARGAGGRTGRGASYYPNQPGSQPGQPINQTQARGGSDSNLIQGNTAVQPIFVQPGIPAGEVDAVADPAGRGGAPGEAPGGTVTQPGLVGGGGVGGLTTGGDVPAQPERFRPTRRSTASLEWRLEPVTEGRG